MNDTKLGMNDIFLKEMSLAHHFMLLLYAFLLLVEIS